jgi:hypothetical protein
MYNIHTDRYHTHTHTYTHTYTHTHTHNIYKGADAFKPMDEDRSVIEYARAGQSLCLNLMGQDDPQTWAATERLGIEF